MTGTSDALEAFQNHSNASIEDTIAALEQLTVSGPVSSKKRVAKDAVSVARTCLKTAHSRLKQLDGGHLNAANVQKTVGDLVKVCRSCVDLLARSSKESSRKNKQDVVVGMFETATYTTLRLFITAAKAFNDATSLALLLQEHFDDVYAGQGQGDKKSKKPPLPPCTPDVINMAVGTTVALVLCWAEGAEAFKDARRVRSTLKAVQSLTPRWLSQISSLDQVIKHHQTLFKSLYRGALRLIENKQMNELYDTCNVMVTIYRQSSNVLGGGLTGNSMFLTAAYKLSSHIVDDEQRMRLLGRIVLDGCEALSHDPRIATIDVNTLSSILSSANSLRKLVALNIGNNNEYRGAEDCRGMLVAHAFEKACMLVATRLQSQSEMEKETIELLQSHFHTAVVGLGYAARLRASTCTANAGCHDQQLIELVATLLGWPWPVDPGTTTQMLDDPKGTQNMRQPTCSDDQISWLSSYLHDVLLTAGSSSIQCAADEVKPLRSSLALSSFMLALERWARQERSHSGGGGLEELMKRTYTLFSKSCASERMTSQCLQIVLWRCQSQSQSQSQSRRAQSQPQPLLVDGNRLIAVLTTLMRAAMQANKDLLCTAVRRTIISSSQHQRSEKMGLGPFVAWAYCTVMKEHAAGDECMKAILKDDGVATTVNPVERDLVHALVALNLSTRGQIPLSQNRSKGCGQLHAAQQALTYALVAISSTEAELVDAELSSRAAGALQRVLHCHHQSSEAQNCKHSENAPLSWTLDLLRTVASQLAIMCGVRGMVGEEEAILCTIRNMASLPAETSNHTLFGGHTLLHCVFPRPSPKEDPFADSLLSSALHHAATATTHGGSFNSMVEALHLAMRAYKESQVTKHSTCRGDVVTCGSKHGWWQLMVSRCRILMALGRMYEDTGMVDEAVTAFKEGRRLARSLNASLLEAVFLSELAVVQSRCSDGGEAEAGVEETVRSALSLLPSDCRESETTAAAVVSVLWYIDAQCRLARARVNKGEGDCPCLESQILRKFPFSYDDNPLIMDVARPYITAVEQASMALSWSMSLSSPSVLTSESQLVPGTEGDVATFPRSASAELSILRACQTACSSACYDSVSHTLPPHATVIYSPTCHPSMAGTVQQWEALHLCRVTPHLYSRAALPLVVPCARAGYSYIAAALLHLSMAPTLQFQHHLVLRTRASQSQLDQLETDAADSDEKKNQEKSQEDWLLGKWSDAIATVASAHSIDEKEAMMNSLEALACQMLQRWVSTVGSTSSRATIFVAAAACPDGLGLLLCRMQSPCNGGGVSAPPLMLYLPFLQVVNGGQPTIEFTVDDALVELDALMEESTYSMKSMPTSTRQEQREWWKCRLRLDDGMERLMARVQRRWFGPWHVLLTTEFKQRDCVNNPGNFLNTIVDTILGQKCSTSVFDLNPESLELVKCLFDTVMFFVREKEKGVLRKARKRGADDAYVLRQVVVTVVEFVRRLFGFEDLNEESAVCSVVDHVLEVFVQWCDVGGEMEDMPTNATLPIVLVPDSRLQRLPFELMPGLQGQSVYRIPSLPCVAAARGQGSRGRGKRDCGDVPSVTSAYYALNPSGDLVETQMTFEEWFSQLPGWQGKSGVAPSAEELAQALRREDLFVYCGHGGGEQYLPPSKLRSLPRCAASLLMGCSSGRLRTCPFTPQTAGQVEGSRAGGKANSVDNTVRKKKNARTAKDKDKGKKRAPGQVHTHKYPYYYEPTGTVLSYLLAGCPVAVATLWDVTDKDIDRFAERLLKGWLTEGGGGDVGVAVSLARSACKLAYFIGGAIVCYGLPTRINGYVA